MKKKVIAVVVLMATAGVCMGALSFEQCSRRYGLDRPLTGIMSHAAACGDFDGDGDLDMYVGAFCDRPPETYVGGAGPVLNMMLVNDDGVFRPVDNPNLSFMARTSGAVFIDLDNDGDLDFYVSNNSKSKGLRVANRLFENVGGRFRDISAGNPACIMMGGRSVGVLDYDGDGLLDMLVAEDKWTGSRTRLFRNLGNPTFADVSDAVGLPVDLPGLGVATVDFNEDGWPDIFVAQANRLLLSDGSGRYVEGDSSVFQHEPVNDEDTPCGAACGDVNGDGWMDIVTVHHSQPARQHLYLNLGLTNGKPQFRDVTAEAGLAYEFPSWTSGKLHLKHAHVEMADFDNDGRVDIVVAATYKRDGDSQPFVCRNLGWSKRGDVPRLDVPPVGDADAYFSAGPVADFDRDGRMDMMLASWFGEIPSKLYINRSKCGHWLDVKVVGCTMNHMGIGATVRVYRPGRLGDCDALIGYTQIGTGFGFCTGQEAIAHFGLGEATACDVEVTLPHSRGVIVKGNFTANQQLVMTESAVTQDVTIVCGDH